MAQAAQRVDAEQPLMAGSPADWGSIKDVLNGPLLDVAQDEWWISIIGMWVFLPLNLIQGLIGGLCQWCYVLFTVGAWWLPGSTCCFSAFAAVTRGRPLWLAFNFWRCAVSGLTTLIAQGKSRLGMFLWEKAAMGHTGYFFQGEGIWTCPYKLVDGILRSDQERKAAFACIRACAPDLYPARLLIFLPNTGGPDSEWGALRHGLHELFLDAGAVQYRWRVYKLHELLAKEWKDPKPEDLTNSGFVEETVSKCVFYVMFGEWVTAAEAAVLANWRRYAFWFILPRLVHRFLFNMGIKKVKQLREDTVGLVEKYGKQDMFARMNASLPAKYRRSQVVQLCDEVMFAIGFAGIGGTSAAVDAVGSFLLVQQPHESPGAKYVDFGNCDTSAKMVAKYKESPEKYIRETLRMVPPVTSACSSFKEDTKVTMAGREFTVPKGLLNQYVLSIANRDETLFPHSQVFDPDRPNLDRALTWNGAFGSADEGRYHRICPGRYLSMDLVQIIVNYALRHDAHLHADPTIRNAPAVE